MRIRAFFMGEPRMRRLTPRIRSRSLLTCGNEGGFENPPSVFVIDRRA